MYRQSRKLICLLIVISISVTACSKGFDTLSLILSQSSENSEREPASEETAMKPQYLSETALFQRCYMQLTNTRAKKSSLLWDEVQSGKKKYADACLEVLNQGKFSAGSERRTIANVNDSVSKSTVQTMHRLHASWFNAKDFPVISWPGHNQDIKDLYDSTTPGFYYTYALFGDGVNIKDVVTSNENLSAVRTTMNPTVGPETGKSISDFVLEGISFAPKGDLQGVEVRPPLIANYSYTPPSSSTTVTGSMNLYDFQGGGLLGTPVYLMLNMGSLSSYEVFKTDGGLKMHRKWGKAVYHDLLCRDLPVVRESDVLDLVDANSTITFRKSAACTRCHASQDRVSAVIRNLKISYVGLGDPSANGLKLRGGNFPTFHVTNQPSETAWPITSDPNYHLRPRNGVLFFRDHAGNLVKKDVSSVADLGQKIAETDDFYICAAKRYYQYFTGIEVDTGDLDDPSHVKLGTQDLKHRELVIQMGLRLKQHQNLSKLIGEILNLDQYRRADFGIGSGI